MVIVFGNPSSHFGDFRFGSIEVDAEMFGRHDLPVETGILYFVLTEVELGLDRR